MAHPHEGVGAAVPCFQSYRQVSSPRTGSAASPVVGAGACFSSAFSLFSDLSNLLVFDELMPILKETGRVD